MLLVARAGGRRGRCRRCWFWGGVRGQQPDLPIIALTEQLWIWRVWLFGFFSRIIRRINEGHIERPRIAKLEDRLLVGCPDPMRVICRHRQN